MGDDKLLTVKGSVSPTSASVELQLSESVPRWVAGMFPGWAAKRAATNAITRKLLQKIETNGDFDRADMEFAKDVFSEASVKWMRRQQIAARAQEMHSESANQKLLSATVNHPPGTQPSEVSEEWLNHFWEDASLVSSKMLQEMYARILATEILEPESCSLRTLRTMRYLDQQTAEHFAQVCILAVDNAWIPRSDTLLAKHGISWSVLIELDDAGLLVLSNELNTVESGPHDFRIHNKLIRTGAGHLSFPGFPLRLAGRDLSKIAQVKPTQQVLDDLIRWFYDNSATGLSVADLPSPDWDGNEDALRWTSERPG